MQNEPPMGTTPMQVVVGPVVRMPTRLLLRALELGRDAGATGLAEAHLICALLESPKLKAALEAAAVPVDVLREHLVSELPRDAPPNLEVHTREDGGVEVVQYGMVELIEGRASVLAAAPQPHQCDSIDLFAAALFDPKSLTTFVLSIAGADRPAVLRHLANSHARYEGIAFPGTRVTTLSLPMRVPWSRRQEVVELLYATLPDTVYWTYGKDGDDMLLRWEDDVVQRTRKDHGFGFG